MAQVDQTAGRCLDLTAPQCHEAWTRWVVPVEAPWDPKEWVQGEWEWARVLEWVDLEWVQEGLEWLWVQDQAWVPEALE